MAEWYFGPGLVSLLIQVVCIVHVLRTDRPWWWIFVILFFPWLGALAYVLVELVPEWRGGARGGRSVPFGSLAGSGQESIAVLKRRVDETPTVENRVRLANAYLRKEKTAAAVEIYEGCLEGFYAEDKNLWYELAEAYHANGQFVEALQYLQKMDEVGFRDYRDRRQLLMALALEVLDRRKEALPRLERLVSTFPGQEANFHYARMLKEDGEEAKARVVVEGMLKRRGSHDPRYRRRERKWYAAAKKLFS